MGSHFLTFCFQEFLASENRPKATRVTRVIQGYESHSFKSNFDSWPAGSAAPAHEEGRGKVAGKTPTLKLLSLVFSPDLLMALHHFSSYAEATKCWAQGNFEKCNTSE